MRNISVPIYHISGVNQEKQNEKPTTESQPLTLCSKHRKKNKNQTRKISGPICPKSKQKLSKHQDKTKEASTLRNQKPIQEPKPRTSKIQS